MNQNSPVSLRYYGISPWEIEVLYSLLHDMFLVEQNPEAEQEDDYTSFIGVYFPVQFSDEFFKWFGHSRWDKVKGILKEMKRRRGQGLTIKTYVKFSGRPNITFIVDLEDNRMFNSAVEKIDFTLELLPYHLDPQKIPQNTTDIIYEFDKNTNRWKLSQAFSDNKKFHFFENQWKLSI